MMGVKDLPDKPKCPRCGSRSIGALQVGEEKIYPLIEKSFEKLSRKEKNLRSYAIRTAQLLKKYGKPAAVALCGKRLHPSDVETILERESKLSDRFFESVLKAEREALSRRFE